MVDIGIMLGRLTPSKGRGIQFFPHGEGEWEKEFHLASQLGLSHIEWVWDMPDNPLLDREFRARVRTRIAETGVSVKGVDLQFLTKNDIGGVSHDEFNRICEAIADIEGEVIEAPLLESSTLLGDTQLLKKRLDHLASLMRSAEEHGLLANIESDLPPDECKQLLGVLTSLGVCYDTGNSHHFGYDVESEWRAYGDRIRNVQIKDRILGGSTVPLGTGGTNFQQVFKEMKDKGYTGLITLQSARGEDGNEIETIKKYLEFIQQYAQSV